MPTVSFVIAVSNDEGYEEAPEGTTGGPWGTLVAAGHQTGPNTDYHSGWRWATTIPQGASINSATLKIRARDALTGTITNVHGVVKGGNVDAAAAWVSTTVVPTTIAKTTAQTAYDPTSWTVDAYYNIDVTAILQEIVNRAGFGGTLAIVLMNNGTTGDNLVSFYRFTDGDTESGKLTVDYTVGAALSLSTASEAEIAAGKAFTLTLTGDAFIPN